MKMAFAYRVLYIIGDIASFQHRIIIMPREMRIIMRIDNGRHCIALGAIFFTGASILSLCLPIGLLTLFILTIAIRMKCIIMTGAVSCEPGFRTFYFFGNAFI